jgi:hypothetical protein
LADKRCDNGHFIDESWDLCPYCPQDEAEPEIPVVRPRSVDPSPSTRAGAAHAVSAAPPTTAPRPNSGAMLAVQPPPMERTVASSQINAMKRYVVGWLVGLSGPSRGESFPVRMGRNVLGRDKRSDIVIHDEQASSHHADLVFRPEERRFILMDHNSTNGTYVNEQEIEPRRDLAAKDVIRIGAQKFLFTPLCHDGFHWDDEGLLR